MNATDVVIDIYRNFPEVEFFAESDRPNDKVKLIFELNEANREMVEEHIKEYNLPYMFLGHTLLIIAPEDSEYKFYGEPLTDEEQAEADRMFPIESLEESKRQFGDIQQKGKAECDYTGGGIYVAYMPVRIKNDDLDEYCYLSYDSESLLIDGEDVPQFTAVHSSRLCRPRWWPRC